MQNRPIIIVVGNEKSGSGKTTTAMQLIASLLYLKFKVVSIDLDIRQSSLTKYIENRVKSCKHYNIAFPLSIHYQIDNNQQLTEILNKSSGADFIVIDTPSNNNYLSQLAHSYADKIITPLNNNFIDIDVLANIDPKTYKILAPGTYSQMIWDQKINRAKRDKGSIDWILLYNFISTIDFYKKANIIKELSTRLGCRNAQGFGDRIIFKELFLKGLTLLDLKDSKINLPLTLSHVAARQELLSLLSIINIEKVNQAIDKYIFKKFEVAC